MAKKKRTWADYMLKAMQKVHLWPNRTPEQGAVSAKLKRLKYGRRRCRCGRVQPQ